MVRKPYRSKKCAGQTGSGPPCKNYEPGESTVEEGPPDPCTICRYYFPDMYEGDY